MSGGGPYRVAVLGATGAVGSTLLAILRERGFPAADVVPFASQRSAGRELDGGLTVRVPAEGEAIAGFDVALLSAGSGPSREWAPRFAAAGAVVVDNSSAWRMQADVPLVVPEVNPEALDGHRGIVANPNCSTIQMVVALKPLHDAVGIKRVVVSTYQSVSGTGRRAIEELEDADPRDAARRASRRSRRCTRTASRSTCCRRSRRSPTATTTRPRSAS